MINAIDHDRRMAEGVAARYRAETGHPLIVPPSMLTALKASGMDTSNLIANRPIPTR